MSNYSGLLKKKFSSQIAFRSSLKIRYIFAHERTICGNSYGMGKCRGKTERKRRQYILADSTEINGRFSGISTPKRNLLCKISISYLPIGNTLNSLQQGEGRGGGESNPLDFIFFAFEKQFQVPQNPCTYMHNTIY